MTTTAKTSPTASGAAAPFDELSAALRGPLTLPSDPGYDQARAVYNGMIDQRPAAIARVADAADVVQCVAFARTHGVDLAIRGGGHHAAGLGVRDGALTVDLGGLRSTTVDPAAHTVRVDGGCTWGDVDHATTAFGMATPSGFVSTTGVGGQTLGGGFGYLTRRFGLSVDNLLSADVVLADGRLVTADADHHPDLFWALRGGGGNFGVVMSFRFRCHEIGEHGTIIGGPVLYALEDAAEVMRWYRELLPSLPEELSAWIGILSIPPAPPFPEELWERKACAVVWCYTGAHDKADAVLEPVRSFGSPLVVGLQPMPYDVLQSAFDPLVPPGMQWYWKADFVHEISDTAIAIHEKFGATMPSLQSTMHLYPIGGAAARVPDDATAFAYRDGGWAGVIVGVDPDPANAERVTAWTREYFEELHPTTSGGAYVNFMMEEGDDRIRASYLGNYERLMRVKADYDPENLFHLNQNIPPAS
jgi:FAD/FMN-containing dehydrogenase